MLKSKKWREIVGNVALLWHCHVFLNKVIENMKIIWYVPICGEMGVNHSIK